MAFRSFWKVFAFRDRKAEQAAEDKADAAWRKAVKERAGYRCEVCQKPGFDAAHIISRRYKATRTDPKNGACLCRQHHREHHAHVLKLYGRDAHDKLLFEKVA